MAKNNFFSFIFLISLSYTSWPNFSIVLRANQKLEWKMCNTCPTLLWPHLRCEVRKLILSFTRRNLINFFVKNLTDWIFISNLLYFIIGLIVKMLFSIVCCCPQHAKLPYGKLGQAWLFSLSGSKEIGIIVALEIRVQLGIRGKPRHFLFLQR